MSLLMLDFVVSPKAKMINVRLTPAVHDQFKIACDLRGVSMSSLLHQFIVRTIREERELEPKMFEAETRATFHNAEIAEFPPREVKISDDSRRDKSKVQPPGKRRSK